ncbi:MAG: protein translocase subunit SecF [Sphingomonadaceae bacterium]
MMLDIVGKRYYYFALSLLVIIPGVISLLLPGGLRPGIDFSSGSIMTIRFEQPVDQADLRSEFAAMGHSEAIVQKSGGSEGTTFLVRTYTLPPEQKDASGNVVEASGRQKVEDALEAKFGAMEVLAFDSVSPIIAGEIVRNAVIAVAVASVGILLYIAYAFRRVKDSFRLGTCAVIALVHDSLIVLGAFSLMGRFFDVELDSMFITAVLTIIGFSVHDTIVVFDRIRENTARRISDRLEDVINHSIMQTLVRSLNTSITVLLVLVALYLFGGVTTQNFVLALIIGMVAGVYSSIFVAASLLVVWERGEIKAGWRRLFGGQKAARAASS